MTTQSENKNKKLDTKQGFFRSLWEGWKKIARKIGDFNARVILTVFYFILLCPFAIMVKLFTDPLEIKRKTHVGWHNKEENGELTALEKATRQS
jgi:lipopolysaccharide/colanic/teichoic acid biosynthesis glycosyltransferase